jgi:hypothetical protein
MITAGAQFMRGSGPKTMNAARKLRFGATPEPARVTRARPKRANP